jgi:phosphatidylserine/phosphatidylglycerophosphate/cardiolipin synthase-like enzyme
MRVKQAEPKKTGAIVALLTLALLAACAEHKPPNTAVPEPEAAAKPGTLQQETPLAAIIRSRGVQPIKPDSPEGLLPQIVRELAKTDPQRRYRGITYNYTSGNALSRDWLVQTPNAWGQAAKDVKVETDLPERLRQLIGSARVAVDIALLKPAPDGAFLDAIRAGIATLALSGRPVEVRLLFGTYPLGPDIDAKGVLEMLAQEARHSNSRLSFHVATMRSCLGGEKCESYTWNHAKFVAVDGERLFSGGHNFWAQDYLGKQPVHDISLFMMGPAAADATNFANALWGFVCVRDGKSQGNGSAEVASLLPGGQIGKDCPARLQLPASRPRDKVKILSVARLGAGITDDFANQNDLARDLLLGAAGKSIFISQQDLGFTLGRTDPLWPESTLERLADFLLADKGDLFIVLSNPNARAPVGESYSNGVALERVAKKFRDVVMARGKGFDEARASALLCRRLHLAPLRFGPDASWPENKPFANHAKFFMVDQRAFYIGSDNFYPVNLQEFGLMIEDQRAAEQVVREYWEPLWRWSGKAAVSGAQSNACVLQPKTAAR